MEAKITGWKVAGEEDSHIVSKLSPHATDDWGKQVTLHGEIW